MPDDQHSGPISIGPTTGPQPVPDKVSIQTIAQAITIALLGTGAVVGKSGYDDLRRELVSTREQLIRQTVVVESLDHQLAESKDERELTAGQRADNLRRIIELESRVYILEVDSRKDDRRDRRTGR